MEWAWLKDWWRLTKWRKYRRASESDSFCFCDECFENDGDLELCDTSDVSLSPQDMDDDGGKVVIVGVCAMEKKTQSKPMKEILTRLQEFEYIKVIVFQEDVILQKPVEEWPVCDCLISFHSKGFPLDKAIQYAQLHNPYVINNLHMQYDIQDRRKVYSILGSEGIEIPRYAVLDRDSLDPKHHELVESEDHVEVNGVIFNKPFVEKPVSAEDHNIYIYYPTSAGGGSQRLFRKIGSRSSVYSPESRVRKTGSFIYEDFMPTDGTDVKVYTVGPDYAHAEARKSPALDGKVERDREGKEIRYPVILSNAEKLISRKVCLAFKQAVCGFDLLRANGKSFVCDVNGFSFVKNSNKYYDDCAKILGNMILRELAPTLHIPWSVPFQLDDPPIVPTTFGKMMELRCVVAVIRHGDRTPKQKMKVEVRHPKFFEIFEKYDGYKNGHVKLKRPKQLQEILDIARSLLAEIQQHEADPEIEEKQGKLEQLKAVLEMYGHFSGINRKVQMKYQPKGRPRGSSSDDVDKPAEPSLVLILKWGGELTPAGRIQAEELGRIFRCMYPGGQGRHLAGEYAGAQGLGLLRLHSTFRHDLKIYASDEGRVQMTAAAFAKGLLALEGELTPILVQMVKSANTNGLLDNDCDSSKYQNMCKARLHELMQLDRDFTPEDREKINPCHSSSIADALEFVKNPVKCCRHVHELIKNLMEIVQVKKEDLKTKDAILYHGETWELMGRRWGKIEKDFFTKNKNFDISKIPDIYDCIKYDLQHNQHTLQFEQAEELYTYAKYLADIVIPQEYGLTAQEKLTIGQGICTPLLKKIKADLQRNIEESGDETVNRLNPRYSHGVSSPGRHVRTRLYFTSESHIHSLITVLRHGGLLDVTKDEQWRRAMEYISMVSELNYMSQIVIMLYEDPTKDPCSEERFHIELHFSPGVNCCVQKNLPPGPGFRPHSRNESAASKNCSLNTSATATPEDPKSQCSPRIDEEVETLTDEDKYILNPPKVLESPPSTSEFTPPDSPESAYRQYLKSSEPIPIGSSHTVSGHEAMHLAKRLNEELANQAQHGGRSYGTNRSASPEPEQRSRSYDHKSPQKSKDFSHGTDRFVTPTDSLDVPFRTSLTSRDHHGILDSIPTSPIEVPVRTVTPQDYLILDSCSFTPIHDLPKVGPILGSFELDPCSLDSAQSVDRSTVSELMDSTDEKCIFLMESSECSEEHFKSKKINAIQKLELADIKDLASIENKQKSSVFVSHASDDIDTLDEPKLSIELNYRSQHVTAIHELELSLSKSGLSSNPLENSMDSGIKKEHINVSSETSYNLNSSSDRNVLNMSSMDENDSNVSRGNVNTPALIKNECSNFDSTIYNLQSSSSLMPGSYEISSKVSEHQNTRICSSSPQNAQGTTNCFDLPITLDTFELSSMSGSLEVELSDSEFSANAARSDISSMPSNDISIRTDTPQDTFTSTYDHSELSFISGPYELDPNDLESQKLALGANIHSSSPQGCRCKDECYAFASPYDRPELSPISGSLDMDPSDLDSLGNARKSNRSSAASSRPLSATNELPLTELNLALFTSKLENNSSSIMSTNELPLSDIRFGKFRRQSTFDSQKDDLSLEVNWETDVDKMDETACRVVQESRHRSFSDPNILEGSTRNVQWLSDKHFLLKKYNDSLFEQSRNQLPVPPSLACYPYSFYPEHAPEAGCPICHYRGGGRAAFGFPYPPPSLVVTTSTTTCMSSSADCGQAGVSAPVVCGQGKRHRHSIAGQMSYFKMLGFGCGGPIGLKKLVGGSANSLFSTAVISGSSSAPNLRDMISNTSSATAIEGCGGVPSIRPLETLHNALSLRQLDSFLDRMTSAPLFRTPSSTPPKYPSTPLPTPNASLTAKSQPLTPSNSLGWSGPPSLMSSSGPSSPGFSESISKGGSSSEMSSSVISGDGLNVDNLTKIFPTAPGLDQDLGNVGMLLDSFDRDSSSSALELSDYFSGGIQAQGGDSGDTGDITPVSCSSEAEFNTIDATAESASTTDVTVTEEIITTITDDNMDPDETITTARLNAVFISKDNVAVLENNLFQPLSTPKSLSPMNSNINIYTNVLHSPTSEFTHVENVERSQPSSSRTYDFDLKIFIKNSNYDKDIANRSININSTSADKWCTNKEKFLENKNLSKTDNIDFGKNLNIHKEKKVDKEVELKKITPGTVVVKEGYIDVPKITRVSKSFHGKSTDNQNLDVNPRRASDSPLQFKDLSNTPSNDTKSKINVERSKTSKRPQFLTQMSQPNESGLLTLQPRKTSLSETVQKTPRFTTTRVDEAAHAASMGISINKSNPTDQSVGPSSITSSICDSGTCLNDSSNEKGSRSDTEVNVSKSSSKLSAVRHGFNVE